MRKLVLATLTMLLLLAVPMSADSFNPGDFTLIQTPAGSNGFVTPNAGGFYMQGTNVTSGWSYLTGGYASSTDYTTTFALNGNVSFNWSAVTHDADFIFDPFSILLNGASLLTINHGGGTSGSMFLTVNAGDVLDFQIKSVDSFWGAGTATISNYNYNPIPEPGSLVLMVTGVLGLAGTIRRKLSR